MVTINTLNGGDITITTGGSTPTARTVTRVWYGDDENVYTDYEISGSISGNQAPTNQIENVSSAKKIEIGSTVTNIGDYAFAYCSSLMNVTIPNGVTSIGGLAFYDCSGLTSVTIPDSVTNIGELAFSECNGLTNVTFLGKTMEQVQNIEDENGDKCYPWSIDTSIINVA